MEHLEENNIGRLRGTAAGRPVLSHRSRGEAFFLLPLTVRRLSGTEDELPLLIRRSLLEAAAPKDEDGLRVGGELRSFRRRQGEGPRLMISVFARSLSFDSGEDENLVRLRGALCREPRLRRTPLGREICDLMLAVRRARGRTDLLPCICWGAQAREAAGWPPGAELRLEGRFQSRPYLKLTEDGLRERTAYEVSAAEIERI